jgi:hypothetical protein
MSFRVVSTNKVKDGRSLDMMKGSKAIYSVLKEGSSLMPTPAIPQTVTPPFLIPGKSLSLESGETGKMAV